MNIVSINLKKEEIVIKLAENSTQKEIIEALQEKIEALKNLYKDSKMPICVTGKVLQNKEIEEVRKLIKSSIDVEIEIDSPKNLGLHNIRRIYERDVEISDTKIHKGSLRSGQRIEFEGSIIVLGDVNFGAEIVAADNIIVMGSLRGIAHAGAKGNTKAIISANSMDTPQIRIANIVREQDKEDKMTNSLSYVYVEGKDIHVSSIK